MAYEIDLASFAEEFREQILAASDVEDDESYRENEFTDQLIDALIEAGEIDDAISCYYRSHGLQLNGYGMSSAGDCLYLFVTICKWDIPPSTLYKSEVETAFKRLLTFYRKSTEDLYTKMEEASVPFDAAQQILEIHDTLASIRFFLLTDCIAEVTPKMDAMIDEVNCAYEIWDIVRLHRLWSSGREREAIEIDFNTVNGGPLVCMTTDSTHPSYNTYLAVFPARLLVSIYEKYGPRLLEKNVRTFLQLRGKINKGIRETILQEPGMFMAYNNGICIVSEQVVVHQNDGKSASIESMIDFQIVNGAQTVASLYNAFIRDKADLSQIKIMVKITEIKSVEDTDDVVPKISQFSNSQNKISMADFSSNHPFHRKIEELSRTIWAPAVRGSQRQTRWFYERSRGQYLDQKGRERTPARKKAYQLMHPNRQKFTKTDLAKFENSWEQLPHFVSRGAQKNFQEFMLRLNERGKFDPDERYFTHLIAKAIMFRQAEKIVQKQKYGGYRANIVTYTLSLLSRRSKMCIDLDRIWKEQCLSDAIENSIALTSKVVFEHITNPPGGANITEWCKKDKCWEAIKDTDIELSKSFYDELIELKPGKRRYVDKGIETVTKAEAKCIEDVMEIPSEVWLSLSLWAKETNNLQPWQRGLAYSIGKHYVGKGRDPSRKQAKQAMKAIEEAKRLGFDPDNPIKPDFDLWIEMKENIKIPVIDVFAGPGGLCEGFNSLKRNKNRISFETILSIEKEHYAHQTLELRAFFRQFPFKDIPDEYYQYLRGEISRGHLMESYPTQAKRAREIAWRAELGGDEFPNQLIDSRISKALNNAKVWVLIGGPPCQAYSIAGRSRMRSRNPETFEKDPRHFLYKEYLRIISIHKPPVFVMENVRGLLSSKINGANIFQRILDDLRNPSKALSIDTRIQNILYRIYPVVEYDSDLFLDNPSCFVVKTENHGIPQARHRVILLGVRDDISIKPGIIRKSGKTLSCWDVIKSLPTIRSQLSNRVSETSNWSEVIVSFGSNIRNIAQDKEDILIRKIENTVRKIRPRMRTGGQYIKSNRKLEILANWYIDKRINGVCNHKAKSHMASDLKRYFYAACFASVYKRSPTLRDFPECLLPNHANVKRAITGNSGLFSDRFRVQVKNKPATTITSHIAKDGHYFIHPDPIQCRSLTVREAARIQTFPDNYFFEGPQTSQYQQVGNAVPPLMAREIAKVVGNLILESKLI